MTCTQRRIFTTFLAQKEDFLLLINKKAFGLSSAEVSENSPHSKGKIMTGRRVTVQKNTKHGNITGALDQ